MSKLHTLIVGGSSGMGFATARELLALGHRVTIAGRSEQKLARARAEISGDIDTAVLDATDYPGLPAAFAGIGAIDHIVLALGSNKGLGPFASVSIDEVRQGFEEKVYPHFAMAQAALPFLAKSGSITFISAVTAHAAMPGTAGIGAANAAIAALVPILAAELRPVRVNGISPGVIKTPWWDFLDGPIREQAFADYAAQTPVGRVGEARDIAQAIACLITNTFVNGQMLVCDGGLQLG